MGFLRLPSFRVLVFLTFLSLHLFSSATSSENGHQGVARKGLLDIQAPCFTYLSQEPMLKNLGLVICMLKTREGFLWIATNEGLLRYDGFELASFLHPPGIGDARFANMFRAIVEDREGNLWLGSVRGLQRFSRETETFSRYFVDSSPEAAASVNAVNCLHMDQDGALWLGTHAGGVYTFDKEASRFTQIATEARHPVTCLYQDRKGMLWAGTTGGLRMIDRAAGAFVSLGGDDEGLSGLAGDTVSSIHEDRHGNLWAGGRTATRVNPERTSAIRYTCPPGQARGGPERITSIVEDSRGGIWVAAQFRGPFRYSPDKDTFLPCSGVSQDITIPDSLSECLLLAEPGSTAGSFRSWIWVYYHATKYSFLTRLFLQEIPYSFVEGFSRDGEFTSWISSITADSAGLLWVQTMRDGVMRLDLSSLEYAHYFPGVRAQTSSCIVMTRDGELYARGGADTYVYQPDNGLFAPIILDGATGRAAGWGGGDSLGATCLDGLYPIAEGRDGLLWFGTGQQRAHLVRFDPRSRALEEFSRHPVDTGSFFDGPICALYEDSSGIVWFGTYGGGMSRLDPRTGRYCRYLADPEESGALRHNSVRGILEDDKGMFWVGTHGGLHSFDRGTEQFTLYPAQLRDQLYVRGMAADGTGNLWMTCGRYLACFRKDTHNFTILKEEDGLTLKDGPYYGIAFDKRTGRMYVGETARVVFFCPDSLLGKVLRSVPNVVLTEFSIFGKPARLPVAISKAKEVILPYTDNFFSFKFAVLDFVDPSRNRYAYKLEGFDRDWRYHRDSRVADYPNVQPGEYLFRVRGRNSVGVWNEEGASVRVVVTPPWWKTTWAYMGYATVAAVLLFGLYQYDRKRTALRHELQMEKFSAEKLREIDEMKMRFFANVSHEFRTPLTLLLGPAEQLLEKLRDPEDWTRVDVIRRSGRRLLELVNQLLDISKLDAGRMKLRVEPIELVRFLRGLVFSFASLAERKQIGLRFDGPEKEVIVAYVDRDKVQKILVNLLSNAFKFTPEGGEIRVAVGVAEGGSEGRVVEIAVSDSGAGIAAEKLEKIFQRFYQVDDSHVREHEGAGIGLSLTKELVELHRGEISVQSEPGRGSTFRVRLPFGKEQWKEEEIVEPVEGAGEVSVRPPVILEDEPVLREEEKPEEGGPEPLVLIVEDNADVRAYVRGSLVPEYRVLEAEDGRGGLEAASSVMPDLIVSDIMMPHIDGIELCRRVKSDERTSHIPVILLTARASDAGKLEGLETGADDYIIKPFDMQELQARIRNLIDLRRKLQEKYRRQCMLEPGDIPLESVDEKFLRKALEVVEAHLSDVDFDNTAFARELCMSRMQLNRKLQALTGRSIHEFIRRLRLQRAAKLLSSHWGNVTEVAYEVGFNSLSSFARSFREHYGVPPSEFMTHPVATE